MLILDGIIDLIAIGIPEFLGEFVTGLFIRSRGGRWQSVAMGDRKRAEREVRFLRRNHISAWIRPVGRNTFEVVVRTSQAGSARALLHAPGSGEAT